MSEEIRVTVKKGGKLQIAVNGVKGPSCKDITAGFLKDAVNTNTVETGEFYEDPLYLVQAKTR
jgi:hypothetical protein